jgi:serine phosphatase RsbU (regulator of sigma subunit)
MKKFGSLFFVSFILPVVFAQQGSPLLTHYTESRDIENQSWAICQDENQVMLFANRKGVLSFDGQDWLTIKTPTIPYAMQKNPVDGKIYIGGDISFGYIEKNQAGEYNHVSLSDDSIVTGIITRIIFNGLTAWFYSEQSVSRYNLETNKLELKLDAKPGYPFTGMFLTPKNTFINVLNKGLHRLESDTLFPIVSGYVTEKTDVLFSLPYNSSLVLVGLGNGTLSLFDGMKYYNYQIKDEGYLKDNILSEGIVLGDTAYAFSTLEGGAVVIDKSTRDLLFTINNQNELPDDEVFAIGSDNTGGLWLSHQYGLTRADLSLPVGNYSIFPGLKGNLSAALSYNNELYVATSEGVFYLSEVKSYDEKQILVKKVQSSVPQPATPETDLEQEQRNTRKNIFARIFGRRTDQQKVVPSQVPAPKPKPVVKYTRKTISKLKSINHLYKKVEGLNEKCRQLVSTPYGILAATNKGLFNINDYKAELVTPDRYINFINWTPYGEQYFIAASDGYFSVRYMNGQWQTEVPDPEFYNPVYSVFRENDKTLWLGGDNIVYRAELNEDQGGIIYFTYTITEDFPERYTLDMINDSVFLYSETGMHYYNRTSHRFDPYIPANFSVGENSIFHFPLSNCRLIRLDDEWIEPGSADRMKGRELSLLKIFDDVVSVAVEDKNLWIVEGNSKLYGIDRLKSSRINPLINVFVKSISNQKGTRFNLTDIKFERGDNVINFDIVAPGYLKQNTTQYQYIISKIMSDWSPWSTRTHYEKAVTKPGEYILQVRAKDLWGNIGEPQSVRFTTTALFTQTLLFYLLAGFIFLVLVILVVRYRERQLHEKNRLLEEKVNERTAEIAAQKQEITSSIEYAGKIQKAMLPMEDLFRESFSDYFILYKPRDIVSGDFYWIGENEKSVFFTVADCTGHGVPGAFMSTMGISTLHEIVSNNRNLQANKVLNLLRQKTVKALHQTGKVGEAADGMDIAFCVLSKDRKKLQYSGAFNPLFIVQGGELREYRANRMPIGIHHGEESAFTNYVINVSKGDTIYIFSDGFASQFGGPEGSKYKKSNFKNLLQEIYYRPMVEQRNILEIELDKWKGSFDQVDDVTILGLRI